MARIIVNRSFNPPEEFDSTLHPCLADRGVIWIRSFVASDNSRHICELEAPYAELVRDGCRQAGLAFDQIWRAEDCLEQKCLEKLDLLSANASLIIVEVVHGPLAPPNQWSEIQKSKLADFQDHDVQPIRSLISIDGRHAIGVFEVASVNAVQQAYNKANIPFTRIWKSQLITP
jgi:hypothetical protein